MWAYSIETPNMERLIRVRLPEGIQLHVIEVEK